MRELNGAEIEQVSGGTRLAAKIIHAIKAIKTAKCHKPEPKPEPEHC